MKKYFIILLTLLTTCTYSYSQVCSWASGMTGTIEGWGEPTDCVSNIEFDLYGNVYIAGFFRSSTLTFNNGTSLQNLGSDDMFLAKFNSTGTCLWAERIAGADMDRYIYLKVGSDNNIYLSGYYANFTCILTMEFLLKIRQMTIPL